jgi:hypothetical protein
MVIEISDVTTKSVQEKEETLKIRERNNNLRSSFNNNHIFRGQQQQYVCSSDWLS